MFSAGFLARAVTDYVGVGNLTKYKVRFAKQTWPGETFKTQVKVTAKRKEDGANLVDLDCTLVNQDGEVKVSGEATAALPSRG
jgi:acyl dehydratase